LQQHAPTAARIHSAMCLFEHQLSLYFHVFIII